jgi:L-seryl-tRNA(Ser) seleniumtransferase
MTQDTDQGGTESCAAGNPFRVIPPVDQILSDPETDMVSTLSDEHRAAVVRRVCAEIRLQIQQGQSPTRDDVRDRVLAELRALERERLTPVINGTGVIIHTNLGRAPVSRASAAAMASAAGHNVGVEIELDTGQRGGRMSEISALMRLLTGAEATLIVNNNAAAILLVLSTVATGREVVVSRGEAVEIGGGFRIPDVLRQSGATLIEIGTTNRTYVRDYAAAISDQTACFLKVHPSNFAIVGFTHSTSVAELTVLGVERAIPVIEDLGSGALIDSGRFGLATEPTIGESIRAGAAVVTASGDKLLGGPQAGIIAGSKLWIERIGAHPLARAVRADKVCLAGIAATLRHYARDEAEREIPVWRMISASVASLEARAASLLRRLASDGIDGVALPSEATVGGGALPGQTLPSIGIAVNAAAHLGVNTVAKALRTGQPPVIPRVVDDKVVVDLRTVLPEDDDALVQAVCTAFARRRTS